MFVAERMGHQNDPGKQSDGDNGTDQDACRPRMPYLPGRVWLWGMMLWSQLEPASSAESSAGPDLAAALKALILLTSLISRICSSPLPHGCLLPPFAASAKARRP
jgi:hypothetical protein